MAVRAWGRRAFFALATVPLAALVWALAMTTRARDGMIDQHWSWIPSIGLDLDFSLGSLQWILTVVIAGIGALVLAYCGQYFSDDEPGLGLLAGTLTAFAGAMLGLVWADNLLLMYVFWELTTVFSFLLIGHDPAKRAARSAAMEALTVTTLGGLAMLVGILLLADQTGTLSLQEILASPPEGSTPITIAVVLLLIGAISKSALVPFHFWLPGAMAAPTPVSAYLHAAAMVKAGVFLVAVLAPAFADVAGWREILLPLGIVTMLLGGLRALRQYDLKLLLAYGTVSQLGFLVTMVGIGTQTAAMAGVALLLAHALFKGTLFLVVGIVDKATGTRDLRKLSGLRQALPWVYVSAVLAGLSMAGIPPLLGFVAKESVYEALLEVARDSVQHSGNSAIDPALAWLVLVGVVLGSALTVAYTARFLWGTFADKPGVEALPVSRPAVGFAAPPTILAVLSVGLAPFGAVLTELFAPYDEQLGPAGGHGDPSGEGGHDPALALWHGLGLPLGLTLLGIAVGLVLFFGRGGISRVQGALTPPARLSAERIYQASLRGLERLAVEVTGFTQRGSVAIYLAVILLVVIALPGTLGLSGALTDDNGGGDTTWWDSPVQGIIALLLIPICIFTARSRRRLRAVFLAGAAGYATAILFLTHGAPDLALTQVLVETVTLVVFVLVLRRLPDHFTDRPKPRSRYWRMLIAAGIGLSAAAFLVVAAGARVAAPMSEGFAEAAVKYGGGYNIVNVTLVDIRVWDTFGEISVLVVAATGVASLLFIDTRVAGIRRVHEIPYPAGVQKLPTRPGRRVWLPGPRTLPPERRSIIFEVITRLAFPTIMAIAIFLVFSGHNNPGGGFAGGLVAGLGLMVRYLAGGRYELDEAAPVDAGVILGVGLTVAALSALAPMAFGGTVLQSAIIEWDAPLLGHVKLVTSLFFDLGVFLVVFGLMLDLLRSLGSGIDRHIAREEREREGIA